MSHPYYSYVSTRTGCDAVPTVFLCPPAADACSMESAEQFAEASGWKQKAEEMAAVLIVPLVPRGWEQETDDLLFDLYRSEKGGFKAPSGESLPGRDGALWLWETILYGVGYDDGAQFLGNTIVAHPNFLAAAALVRKGPERFAAADAPSDHWLVPDASDYNLKNWQIPVAVDLYGNDVTLRRALCSFRKYDYRSRVRTIDDPDPAPEFIFRMLFDTTVRWKNGPDGTLATYCGRTAFEQGRQYQHYLVSVDGQDYPYAVRLPKKTKPEDTGKLAVVLNLHGRGEPAWLFAEKNGWHTLSDETGEFLVVTPDSAQNMWFLDRDYGALEAILADLKTHFDYDETRVYVTGFSNGAVFTAQQATTHPQLFAAASPWNGPFIDRFVYDPAFPESGYEMPFFIMVGDSDDKAPAVGEVREAELDLVLRANHCRTEPVSHEVHDRFDTKIYENENGVPMAGFTVMKNMPHGAITEQTRAAWDFMKHFRRMSGEKEVRYERDDV